MENVKQEAPDTRVFDDKTGLPAELLEKMKKLSVYGEIEMPEEPITEVVPEVKVEPKEEVEEKAEKILEGDDTIEINGKKYTIDQISKVEERISKNINSEDEGKQEQGKDELSQLREQAVGDPLLERIINNLVKQTETVTNLEKEYKVRQADQQRQKDEEIVSKMKDEVEKKYGKTLPDVKSDEFKVFMERAMKANPVEVALLLSGLLDTKSKEPPKTMSSAESMVAQDESVDADYLSNLRAISEKAGVNFDSVKKFIRKG